MPRKKPEARKAEVVAMALKLAEKSHYLKVSRAELAVALGITPQAVRHYFATMPQMQGDLVRAAIKQSNLVVIAQAVTANDPKAKKLGAALRRQAMESMINEDNPG